MSFGGESGLQKLGLCGIHPLTQRYVSIGAHCILFLMGVLFTCF
ncbi:DUF3265 domain-containing protein [Vibrio vulnificus]|nr:DUF3265 domain-containing protein [Vibrio vulnificus]EIU7554689.1 DUF3265 domain-containing protein [Vibrio vulnificus]